MDKKNARKARQRKLRNRRIALTLCLMLTVAVASIGGTIAWLTASTAEVKNTFTVGDIDVTLIEHKYENGKLTEETTANQSYPLIPGNTYKKDPTVTIDNDVDAYLFVEFDPGTSLTYLNYTSTLSTENGWTQGDGTYIPNNVWYRIVSASANEKSWLLISNSAISVKEEIVDVDTTNSSDDDVLMPTAVPTMTYKAYAVQKDNLTTNEAWKVATTVSK